MAAAGQRGPVGLRLRGKRATCGAAPVLGRPASHHRAGPLTYDQFRCAFALAISEEEAKDLLRDVRRPRQREQLAGQARASRNATGNTAGGPAVRQPLARCWKNEMMPVIQPCTVLPAPEGLDRTQTTIRMMTTQPMIFDTK